MVDAVGIGNVIEALRILNQLLIEGEPPLRILMMVVRQFRLLWKVKATLVEKKSMPPRQLAGQIGVPARTAEQLSRQVRRFSQVQLKQGLKRLSEVDRALKSSTNAPKILLEDVLKADIERKSHLASGDGACVYHVRSRSRPSS